MTDQPTAGVALKGLIEFLETAREMRRAEDKHSRILKNNGDDTQTSRDDADLWLTRLYDRGTARQIGAWIEALRTPASGAVEACDHEAFEVDDAGQPTRCADCLAALTSSPKAAPQPLQGGEVTVWVVYGDDHDYDCMSQWLVGVFATEDEANKASEADRERYVRDGGDKDQANYSIESTTLALLSAGRGEEGVLEAYDMNDLNGSALAICEAEIRDWSEIGPSRKTDIHAAVKAALSLPAGGEDEAWLMGLQGPLAMVIDSAPGEWSADQLAGELLALISAARKGG